MRKVLPKNYADVEYGFIDSEGNLYKCNKYDHYTIEEFLERVKRDASAIHISEGDFAHGERLLIRQAQMDTLFDYCQASGVKFPENQFETI